MLLLWQIKEVIRIGMCYENHEYDGSDAMKTLHCNW